MKFPSLNHRLLIVALLATAGGLGAAETTAGSTPAPAKASVPAPADVKAMTDKLEAQKNQMIAEHDKLAAQYRTATEEQRKAIRAKMEAQQKDFVEAQRALVKQIRDEMHRIRQGAAPGH